MDNQTVLPGSSSPFGSTPNSSGRGALTGVLLVILGLGTAIFGTLTVIFSTQAIKATSQTNSKVAAAVAKARDDQKKQDTAAATLANESPYLAYTAPEELGSFVINYPKTWSVNIDRENSSTQVQLTVNPVAITKAYGVDAPVAARVSLITRDKTSYMGQFANNVKNGKVKQTSLTVSGQPAYDLTTSTVGILGGKILHEVVVPIRDKVLVFTSENNTYAAEFGQMVSQAKVNP
ncbi:MAG TPA: hypothetical protein VHQ86_04620 [Candidatus Saccharimonadia bacterium]|nr:hypothetical protein [Candidatus Saccharimonadia bacterium]